MPPREQRVEREALATLIDVARERPELAVLAVALQACPESEHDHRLHLLLEAIAATLDACVPCGGLGEVITDDLAAKPADCRACRELRRARHTYDVARGVEEEG